MSRPSWITTRPIPNWDRTCCGARALLDTHDTLTDRYKHLRSGKEIAVNLAVCGMTDIHTAYAGNGVEARARKQQRSTPREVSAPDACN